MTISKTLLLSLVSLLVFAAGIIAQSATPEPKPRVRTVTIPISIFSKQELKDNQAEEYVQADRLIVKEGSTEQQILSIRSVGDSPMSIALLIQEDLTTNFNLQIRDIQDFIRNLPKGTRVMVAYGRAGSIDVRQRFTDDLEKAAKSIRIVAGSESMAPRTPFDPVSDVLSRFDSVPTGRRAILMFSDGLDTSQGTNLASISQSFDLDQAILKAQKKSVAVYSFCSSREELLNNCDAVLVCAPNKTHIEIATAAVEAGKHVFCEKPFATGMKDAAKLLATADRSGGVFQVGHSRRFSPVYLKLKELLSQDQPHSAHIKMNRGELKNPFWTGDVNITGGFLYETTIHFLDMLRFQFGEIEELIAYGSQHEYPEIDDFSVIFKFKSGFHCTFASSSDASWYFPFERIEVFCHHRTIMTEEMVRLLDCRGLGADFETYSFHMLDEVAAKGFLAEDAAFINAIINGTEPMVTALDGYRAVELVESVYESIRTGARVRF